MHLGGICSSFVDGAWVVVLLYGWTWSEGSVYYLVFLIVFIMLCCVDVVVTLEVDVVLSESAETGASRLVMAIACG